MTLPSVTVIVPNWNGRQHLERCFGSLLDLEYDGEVRLMMIDNGSVDGSLSLMRRRFGEVTLIENRVNQGFAAACDAGAERAETELVAFLNNDMRVERTWLSELARSMAEEGAGCAASLILSWDGRTVNYAGGGMNFHGIGIQIGLGDPLLAAHREPSATLFACGGAMAIRRDLFLSAGGFDPDYFAYYEDVDLGWRLWLLGECVRFVPSSVAYHHHSATSGRIDIHRLRLLQIRNPLYTIFKNYEDENLRKVLPVAILLTLRRTKYQLVLNDAQFSLEEGCGQRRGPLARFRARLAERLDKARVSRAGLADLLAISQLTDRIKVLSAKRREIQARRRRADAEILPLFRDPLWPAEAAEEYPGIQQELLEFFDLVEVFR
ncbi:MAG: glycosyltransferase family 2 protein [Planctomycetota bacterium]